MARIFRALLIAAVNTIKEFFAFATKECLEAGLKNATIVGELNNEDGVFSGFSVNDRIKIDNNLPSSFNSMTFIVNFKTPSTIGTDDYPIIIQNDAVKDIFLEGSTKTICQWNGSTKNSGITQLQENTDYELKIVYENGSYTCYVDNISQFTTSNDIFKGALLCFGGSAVNIQYFEGSIDMNNTSITIDGVTTNFYSTIPEVGDGVKLNDGMATSNYDWSAYPSDTEITGDYTQTGTIEKVKQIGDDFVYGMQEPEQDNKDVTINVGQMYYAYTNANDESVYTTDNPIKERKFNLENAMIVGTSSLTETNGIYSGFSDNNYISVTNSLPILTTKGKMIFKITYTSGAITQYILSATNENKCLLIYNGQLQYWDGSSGIYQGTTFQNNNTYWIGIDMTSNSLTAYTILDNNNIYTKETLPDFSSIWNQEFTFNSNVFQNISVKFATGSVSGGYWRGKLDLANTYFNYDDIETTFGSFSDPSTLYDNTFTALNPQPEFEVGTGIIASDLQNGAIVIPVKEIHNSMEMVIHFKTGSSWPNLCLCDSSKDGTERNPSVYFQNYNAVLVAWLYSSSYTSGDADIANNYYVGFNLDLNKEYWFKTTWDGTAYKFYVSTNGDNYTIGDTLNSTVPINWVNNYLYLGNNYDTSTSDVYQNIYLNGTYIKVDGETIFNGSTAIENIDFTNTGCTLTGFALNTIKIGNNLYRLNDSKDEVKDIPGLTFNTVDNTTINTVTVNTPTYGYIDTPYYAYTNTNDNTDTLYATDNPISKGTFNLENASVVGTLTDNNGIFSGFTTSNYLLTQDAFNPQNQNWNIEVNLITGDNVSTEQGFIGGGGAGYKVLVEVYNQHFRLMLSSNNSSFNILNSSGSYTVQPSTEYWVRVSYDTITGYKLEYKTSSTGTYTLDISTSDTTNIYNVSLPISLGANKYSTSGSVNLPFYGSIDMLNTSITIDNVNTYFGSLSNPSVLYENTGTTEFTPIVLDPQPSFAIEEAGLKNATIIGELNNEDGVYSGFSSSSGIVSSTTFSNTFNTFEILMKIKTSNNITDNQIFFCTTASTSCEIALNVWSGTFAIFLSSNGQSWDIANAVHGSYSVLLNTDYYVKLVYNGSNYVFSYSLDGATFINDIIINDSTKVGSFTPTIGNWVKNGTNPETNYFSGSIDLNNTSITIDEQTTNFYNPKSGIIIENDLYERNSTKDDYIRTLVPATIETSANITTSNNDNVITDGSYHLFNLTIPTDMTPIIESSGISYQTNEMPLLLKSNTGVGFLLKDGNNCYYRNTWKVNKDYNLHYQQINFSYPSGAIVTCKVNNAPQNDLTPICYCGDVISWTCDNAGTITTGTYTVKYSNLDGNIQTITIS